MRLTGSPSPSRPALLLFVTAGGVLLVLALLARAMSGLPTGLAVGPGPNTTSVIRAQVLGKSGTPAETVSVEGAIVEVKGLGLRATTDPQGAAHLLDISVPSDPDEAPRVDVIISAPGYGSFTYLGVPLYPNDAAILTPVLNSAPQVDDLRLPVPPVREQKAPMPHASARTIEATTGGCSGWSSTDTPPDVIRVYHNGPHDPDYEIHTIDFKSYVKHVLPREWIPSWHQESLRAGGMAVKMYGWYWTIHWRGGQIGGECYDVDSSTSYQVWDPNYSQGSTNQAVDYIWNDYLTYAASGTPYETQYRAGAVGESCGYLYGAPAPGHIMSQNGTQTCALESRPWDHILVDKYYFDPASALEHHGPPPTELVTNGGFESGSTGWVLWGDFYADSRFTHPHSGTGYAYLSNADGTPGNNLVGALYQTVTIPSSATSATLTFWYSITTAETGSAPYDVLNVTIENSAGDYLATVAVFDNADSQPVGVYSQESLDMSPYVGQTIRAHFLGTTNASLPTVFRIDDVSILAAGQTPAECVFSNDLDCDACWDSVEHTLSPPADPSDPWDWYDVPVPTLFSGGHISGDGSGLDSRDHAISIIDDLLAALEYAGTSDEGPPNAGPDGIPGTADDRDYDQDVNGDGVDDGRAYDRSVAATRSGPPDGAVIIIEDVLLVLDQCGQSCGSTPP